MRIKALLIMGIIVLFIFLIYLSTMDKKVYYLALGDSLALGKTPYGNIDYGYTDYIKDYLTEKNLLEKCVNNYADNDYRITDLIRDIIDNKKITINNKEQTLKNALIKADLITLSIGLNDLLYKLNSSFSSDREIYNHIDEMMVDMEQLFKLLKEYCKEDIMVLGYYSSILYLKNIDTNKYIKYANEKLKVLCDNYSIHYIEIDSIFKNNSKFLPNPLDTHPSKLGYEAIANEFIKKIDKTLLK